MTKPTASDGLIKLAILAVGGQGGGVLTNWIRALAQSQGYSVQATSVAGVAQRTGSTIYYIEMAPEGDAAPVFALAPAAGDVDILIAAELTEAGRAIQRGFVTPDQTVLIASSHRVLAVSEKVVPGDGILDGAEVVNAARVSAKSFIMLDGEKIAARHQSVISAALFGALAGSEVLPFSDDAFEAAIHSGGKGIEASLNTFREAAEIARCGENETAEPSVSKMDTGAPRGPKKLLQHWTALTVRAARLPDSVAEMTAHGLRKVVVFQDHSYGSEYLDHLDRFLALDSNEQGYALSIEAAKHIANAMAYDDVIRIAGVKTRPERTKRVMEEMNDSEVLRVTEFFHPRAEEIVGLLPARLGSWFENNSIAMKWVDRLFAKGRRIRSDRFLGFATLYILGGLKSWRLKTRRHQIEQSHMENWLNLAIATAREDYHLGCEVLKIRRLIKGYSDTHQRGFSKFGRITSTLPLIEGRPDAADWLRRLNAAALLDEEGEALDGAIQTIQSL